MEEGVYIALTRASRGRPHVFSRFHYNFNTFLYLYIDDDE